MRPTLDRGFAREIRYDVPLTDGFEHRFLRNVAPNPRVAFSGLINPEVVPLVAAGRFDALIVHGYASASTLLALLTPRFAGRTRVLLRGESHLLEPRPATRRAVKQVLLRPLFARIDHFLAIGTRNREYYRAYGVSDERITIAPYAVDNTFFTEASRPGREQRAQVRSSFGLAEGVPVFVFCAKFIPVKRPLDVIRAFAAASRRGDNALVVVGE
ncbi:MAG: glycosyltransferase, partial [Myxococcales bacterium]